MSNAVDDNFDVEGTVETLVSIYGNGGVFPTAEQWRKLFAYPPDATIFVHQHVKIDGNLLRGDSSGQRKDGAHYAEVSDRLTQGVGAVTWYAGKDVLIWIGEDTEQWDIVGLVEFPNWRAVAGLFLNPEYIEIQKLRASYCKKYRTIISVPRAERASVTAGRN